MFNFLRKHREIRLMNEPLETRNNILLNMNKEIYQETRRKVMEKEEREILNKYGFLPEGWPYLKLPDDESKVTRKPSRIKRLWNTFKDLC